MKTINYLIALFSLYTVHCAEQLPAALVPIFNDIVDIINTPKFEYDLEIFLQSETALLLKDALNVFSQEDKNKLMEKVHNIAGGDFMRHRRRNFLAAIIKAGGDIDANLSNYGTKTFLGNCVLHNDTEGVTCALKHNANPCLKYDTSPILSMAKTESMISLLMEHRHYTRIPEEPFKLSSFLKTNTEEQYDVLVPCIRHNRSAEILDFYRKKGFNLKLRDEEKWSLLHRLCAQAADHTTQEFFKKFQILLEEDAIDLGLATANTQEKPLDIINRSFFKSPTIELARGLIQCLENNPRWMSQQTSAPEELSNDSDTSISSRKRTLAELRAEADEAWLLIS